VIWLIVEVMWLALIGIREVPGYVLLVATGTGYRYCYFHLFLQSVQLNAGFVLEIRHVRFVSCYLHSVIYKCYGIRLVIICMSQIKVKQSHTGLGRPLGLQVVEAPRFLDNRHMKVVRLSALRTGRLYSPGKIPGTHFC
jgi:hypothetical protein